MPRESVILFVCLHGSAKSLIAASHLNRIAEARGMSLRAESAGMEPDADVPQPVVEGLARDGIDVRGYRPNPVTPDRLREAPHVVSFGCDIGSVAGASQRVETWNDVPMVSDGYAAARAAIVARVERLLAAYGA